MLRSFFSRLYASLVSQHMAPWLWVSVVLTIAIAVFAPQQLRVTLYKLSLITTAAWVAYWIDRALFPYARPDRFVPPEPPAGDARSADATDLPTTEALALAFSASQLRRALIISAAMIGVALGA